MDEHLKHGLVERDFNNRIALIEYRANQRLMYLENEVASLTTENARLRERLYILDPFGPNGEKL